MRPRGEKTGEITNGRNTLLFNVNMSNLVDIIKTINFKHYVSFECFDGVNVKHLSKSDGRNVKR